jgi:hypothetical protein
MSRFIDTSDPGSLSVEDRWALQSRGQLPPGAEPVTLAELAEHDLVGPRTTGELGLPEENTGTATGELDAGPVRDAAVAAQATQPVTDPVQAARDALAARAALDPEHPEVGERPLFGTKVVGGEGEDAYEAGEDVPDEGEVRKRHKRQADRQAKAARTPAASDTEHAAAAQALDPERADETAVERMSPGELAAAAADQRAERARQAVASRASKRRESGGGGRGGGG